ncbi:MAG: DUF2306 domain-containing protein [Pseudonocardiaceae bacterium]|nr:DUF2306 domain-containing protein [Pseudonocardiaceae bacterium]
MAVQLLIACHVLAGLTAVVWGAGAMLAPKRRGRHPRRGRAYLVALAVVAATGTTLAATDWQHLWHLAALGATAAGFAVVGYATRPGRRAGWLTAHIIGMSGSYVAMLTAFYVDNGPRLPLWQLLPPGAFWFLPTVVGVPLLVRALARHRRRRPRTRLQRSPCRLGVERAYSELRRRPGR